jgi:hypothetical protein
MSPSEIAGSGGVPTKDKQEGERAGIPHLRTPKGHRESSEARG